MTGLLGVLTGVAAAAAISAGPDGAFGVAALLMGAAFLLAWRRTRRQSRQHVLVTERVVHARGYAAAVVAPTDPRTTRLLRSTFRC